MMLRKQMQKNQLGFSLVEILVGLVIGLLATLVIMQVFAAFEGQKRTTTGNSDAQTNGSIALFTLVRDIQMAGFGLPVFDKVNPALKCDPAVSAMTVDHDGNGATPNIDMFPISITDGGATGSDIVRVRYATDGATITSGVGFKVISKTGNDIGVDSNFGCNNGDSVLLSAGATCSMTRVNDAGLAGHPLQITLTSGAGATVGGSLACMGQWNQFTYTVANNQLQRNDASSTTVTPIVPDVVRLKAQYGISADPKSNQIALWVSATGVWATPGVTSATCDASNANRNCIKAVHVAIVARNGLLEKTNVTTAAPLAWAAIAGSTTPTINLSADTDWQRYRYRVYDNIIPLRNMIWSKNTL